MENNILFRKKKRNGKTRTRALMDMNVARDGAKQTGNQCNESVKQNDRINAKNKNQKKTKQSRNNNYKTI